MLWRTGCKVYREHQSASGIRSVTRTLLYSDCTSLGTRPIYLVSYPDLPTDYLRCTQKEERLTALGLVHTHYHAAIDVDTVCKFLFTNTPTRMGAANLLFQ